MAAAEYFSNVPMAHPSPSPYTQGGPMSHPQSSPQVPQVQMQQPPPPPPYQEHQEHKPGVHFAPTPVDLPQRHSFSGPRPSQPWNQQSYQNPYQQQLIRPQNGYGTPPNNAYDQPRPQYLSPHMQPYAHPNPSRYSIDNGGYSSDPEQRRRRHEHRTRRDSGESRDLKSSKHKSRSANADAFLGAAGGGLIGDLIFPGLGTIGGAAIGWLGGKDYAHHRKGREDKRAGEQRRWEEKYGPEHHRRSRSRERSSGRSSQLGEKDGYDRHSRH
ncbi:hypothetical protein LTS08_005597 [Lithohypha guttulata]|uniref:Uncharacterized protein n=1 Tax=Lithohypha guttulata TaxID=1690604 RepID=A0AAN7T2I0_9EURO|nr:hypothetical protein LTR51_003232 [Lithohypha guttulata]KAK5087054.1 hypothetical protein LTR05_004225 [Lithohypha guttulata]KAK5099882.1 hypothetical protein LTS08_005597 [Lithohypha guttulata]